MCDEVSEGMESVTIQTFIAEQDVPKEIVVIEEQPIGKRSTIEGKSSWQILSFRSEVSTEKEHFPLC